MLAAITFDLSVLPTVLGLFGTGVVSLISLRYLRRLGLERARAEVEKVQEQNLTMLRQQAADLRSYNDDLKETVARLTQDLATERAESAQVRRELDHANAMLARQERIIADLEERIHAMEKKP